MSCVQSRESSDPGTPPQLRRMYGQPVVDRELGLATPMQARRAITFDGKLLILGYYRYKKATKYLTVFGPGGRKFDEDVPDVS